MKRHLSSVTIFKGALSALSIVGILAFVSSNDVVADHLPDDPNQLFATHNGDTNADGNINLVDVTRIFNYLYSGGPKPKPLSCEPFADPHNGDVNDSGDIDLTDAIYLLNWLFIGGPAPVEGCPNAG